MAAYGLYTHIASNKTRSMLLLAGLFCLIYVMVFAGALIAEVMSDSRLTFGTYIALGLRDLVHALPYATIGTAVWIVIAYFFHQKIIDMVTGGHDVTRQEQPRLYNLLENLCISRGIPMPKLKIMDSDALNAFATGLNKQQYAITVTTGLLAALDDHEIEAVLGHELTHIRNGDVQLMVVAVIINSSWNLGGISRSRSSSDGERRGGGGGGAAMGVFLIAVLLIGVAWTLSQMVRLALSRSREFLADAGSVELTKNPDAMISALRKIEGRGELPGATSAVMEMCLDNPREGFADLFATHPSVEARVDALVRYAGGHDPGPLPLPAPDSGDGETEVSQTRPPGPWDGTQISQPPAANSPIGPWGPRRWPWRR